MRLYLISGLGADERVFRKLKLKDAITTEYIPWAPLAQGDDIVSYAHKMSKAIDTSSPFAVAGLSFGGLLAMEIKKILPTHPTILLSSVPTRLQLPSWFRVMGKLGLPKIFPKKLLTKIPFVAYWYFGMKTSEEKALLKDILQHSDPDFISWALNEIFCWKNETVTEPLYRIHGSDEKVFPLSKAKEENNLFVVKGGHFMIYGNAAVVSNIVNSLI